MVNLNKSILATFIFVFAANINAQTQTAIIGESSQLKFNISNVTNTNKCHIEVTLPNQQKVGVEVDGPQFLASVEFTPQQIGNNVIQWEGKNKLRGLKSVFACPGSGVIQVQVNGNTEQVAQKWNQYFLSVNEDIRDCVKVGMDLSQLKYQVLADPTVTLTSPQDPKLKPIYEKCESFAKQNQPRKGAPCTLASQNNLKTICDGVYAERQPDGRLKTISRTAAIQMQFEGKPWTVGVLENLDARTARLKQEGEDKAKQAEELAAKKQAEELAAKKQAEELAAKKQAEEKERLFKLSPEYKKQQAEIVAREQAVRLEAERAKAKQERERIETEKAAVEQKRKDEEARVRALANLKVKNVSLGVGAVPCTPEESTYVDIIQKPVRLQYECSFGSREDETQVIFAADRKTVVSVTRRQFLKPSDPEPSEVVKAAIRFYGPPAFHDDGNWTAIYGNPYTPSYTGRRINLSRNEQGVGLLIHGKLCADGSIGTARCGNLGTTLIEYELVNRAALVKSYDDGKDRLAAKNSNKINNQKF